MRPTAVRPGKRPLASDAGKRRRPSARVRLDTGERRAQLVALGLEHFGTRAYDDVSIDAIAASAGISKGLLYHYFPTKKAYYAACVREAAEELVAQTDTSASLPPLDRLYQGLDAYLSYVRAHARAYATLMKSGVGVDPEIARIVDETRSRLLERITEGFDEAPLAKLPTLEREDALRSPLVRTALRGWVGLAEATALGWIEDVERKRNGKPARNDASPTPTQEQMRNFLAAALVQIVQAALHVANPLK
ncbi:MAG: TetR/AcrR family transcriptional regulator [Labilithrix sp.]|nr:TetR/AcrR family transcriptional regulator [Labilithrix sp.]